MGNMNLTLFRIEDFDDRDGKIALLPGVPRELLAHSEVRKLRQGSEITLRCPNGTRRQLRIADYYVRTPVLATKANLDSAPIVLVLEEHVSRDQVPIGSEVQIVVN